MEKFNRLALCRERESVLSRGWRRHAFINPVIQKRFLSGRSCLRDRERYTESE